MKLGVYLINDVKETSKNNFNNISFTKQYISECLKQLNSPITELRFWTDAEKEIKCDAVITIDCSDGFDFIKVKSVYYSFILCGVKFEYGATYKKIIDFLRAILITYHMFHLNGKPVEQYLDFSIPTLIDYDKPLEHENNIEYNVLQGVLKDFFVTRLTGPDSPVIYINDNVDRCKIHVTFNATNAQDYGVTLNECMITITDNNKQGINHVCYPDNTIIYTYGKCSDGFFNTKDCTVLLATTLNQYGNIVLETKVLTDDKELFLKFSSKRNPT